MRTIDMRQYQPFANMGASCQTRKIREKKVRWPLIKRGLLDGAFRIRIPGRGDLDRLTEFWRSSYPEGYGSSLEWIYSPAAYHEAVALFDDWNRASVDKNCLIPIVEEVDSGNLVACCLFTKDDKNLNVEFALGAVHPSYRKNVMGARVWTAVLEMLRAIEEESGAEYMTAFCATWHDISQHLCLKQWGFKVAGIFPGQYTRWCGGEEEYRACEIHFYKFISTLR